MKVKEAFTPLTEGIFTYLQRFDVPWKDLNIEYSLNVLYITHSGEKTLSTLYDLLVGPIGPRDVMLEELARTLYTLFSNKWARQYATMGYDYDPISNYDSYERMTPKGKIKNDTETGSELHNSIYGYNSEVATDADSANDTGESHNTQSFENYYVETEKRGNIGVTTSQQMLMSEIELWRWKFFEEVFNDLDSYLTIPIYERRCE